MKLIITGATGFVGTAVLRASLRDPRITTVVALSRSQVVATDCTDTPSDRTKLVSVLIKDYDDYPDNVRAHFAGAGACIWTVGITPAASKNYTWDEVRRVTHDCTVAGLNAMIAAHPAQPFRFVYMSGIAAERDQTKTPPFLPEHGLLKGEVENSIIAIAAEHQNRTEIEPRFIKTALIVDEDKPMTEELKRRAEASKLPVVPLHGLARVMIDQTVKGFSKESLLIDDILKLISSLPQ
ncbi:uncharacterized protein B0I36DRAFT_389432 [Microdochium trichocladiopsis]|uniref:NAD(P)-binding domain-containing protein n=1 Tax=Microdochium trichocladiopsis TaxID=1682393 RepID=A0A9P8XVJ7_9PEZI|nr:uncharacterized protein B0I36DRAFT_389432 [Microdochium trichocladiopsis]KAH7014577.1 hypothetical protein B0I36DRAFT_389432 [Microdochium trichocladiopsis]